MKTDKTVSFSLNKAIWASVVALTRMLSVQAAGRERLRAASNATDRFETLPRGAASAMSLRVPMQQVYCHHVHEILCHLAKHPCDDLDLCWEQYSLESATLQQCKGVLGSCVD